MLDDAFCCTNYNNIYLINVISDFINISQNFQLYAKHVLRRELLNLNLVWYKYRSYKTENQSIGQNLSNANIYRIRNYDKVISSMF